MAAACAASSVGKRASRTTMWLMYTILALESVIVSARQEITPRTGFCPGSVMEIAVSATSVRYCCQALSCGWETTTCVPFRSTTLGQEGVVAKDACCAEPGIEPAVRHIAIVITSRLLNLTMWSSRGRVGVHLKCLLERRLEAYSITARDTKWHCAEGRWESVSARPKAGATRG